MQDLPRPRGRIRGTLLFLALLLASPACSEGPVCLLEHAEFVPASATREHPCPLVVYLHGAGGSAAMGCAFLETRLHEGGFAILAPQGRIPADGGFTWDGEPETKAGILASIRGFLKGHPEVDQERIVWVGMSAGCHPCCLFSAGAGKLCRGMVLMAAPRVRAEVVEGEKAPRTCVFLGTKDSNFRGLDRFRQHLKVVGAPYALNVVDRLGHAAPDGAYLKAAVHWVLESEDPSRESRLPRVPPPIGELVCRQALFPTEAEAEEAAKKPDGGASVTEEDAERYGDLLRWACWTLKPGETRVLRTAAGFHAMWRGAEPEPKREP